MTARWCLVVLILGTGLGLMVFADHGTAQIPGEPQRPSLRLDDTRLTALRNRIRQHALSLKPEDIANLSGQGKPLASPFGSLPQKPGADLTKPKALPQAALSGAAVSQKTALTDAKKKEGKAPAHDPAKKSKTGEQAKKPPFDPYPRGPEPRVPHLPPGYHPNVRVLAPGRLDWTFVVSKQSLEPAPTALTAGYMATRQSYELYVPPAHRRRQTQAWLAAVGRLSRPPGLVC